MRQIDHGSKLSVKAIAGKRYATLDPGNDGALLVFGAEGLPAVVDPNAPRVVAATLDEMGVDLLVIETQYIRDLRKARSVLRLSQGMGFLLGWIAREKQLSVVEVAPSTWQAYQRRAEGLRREKGLGIRLAMKRAGEAWGPMWPRLGTVKKREGIASAYGIHEWWRDLAVNRGRP